jgi:hypothetical protein
VARRPRLSCAIDGMTKACQACRAPQFEALLPVDFAAVHARHHTSETNSFILIHVAERIFAAGGLQHNICKPAQRRHDVGVDVAIVAHQHRGGASTSRES